MNQSLMNISQKFKMTFGIVKKDKQKKGSAKDVISKLSKGLMLPIAILPIAGIFLGVGAAIVNNASGNQGLIILGNFIKMPGDVIFGTLPVLFAIAIAIAFTNDAGPAGLSALVGFLVFGAIQLILSQPVHDPAKPTEIIGYNLLFYGPNSLGDARFGLPKSLFGNVLGINQLVTSVFGGFLVGFIVAYLYNKYKKVEFPKVLGFFNGIKFIPIITFVVMIPVTFVVLIIWPLIGIAFNAIGGVLGGKLYGFNSFIFGYIERSLVPFGLQHAFYSPLWYTQVGGSLDLTKMAETSSGIKLGVGTSTQSTWLELARVGTYTGTEGNIQGDQNLWFFVNSYLVGKQFHVISNGTTNMMSSSVMHTITFGDFTSLEGIKGLKAASGASGINIGQYLQGKYIFMILGLPGAALAIIKAAPKENRKMASSIVISAGFTAFLTGITEPIEFTFLFLAPWLFWGFHAFMCALAFGLMNWIGLITAEFGNPGLAPHLGMTFSGGIIDWIIYGGLQIQYGSNAWWSMLFGIVYFPIYFFFFYWAIKKFNIATPGRGENTKLFTKADWQKKQADQASISINTNLNLTDNQMLALKVVKAYGGFDNLENVDACITKLRINVRDPKIVDENELKNNLGALGIIKPAERTIFAVYGGKADVLKTEIKEFFHEMENDENYKNQILAIISDNSSASEMKKEEPKATMMEKEMPTMETSDEKIIIKAPVSGKIVPLSHVPDETFSKAMLGQGVAIIPSTSIFSAPIAGELSLVYESKHAYIFQSKKGTQILVHIGIDSINLKDAKGMSINPFNSKVDTGHKVKTGDPVASVKLAELKKYAKSVITPIIVLDESLFGRKVKILKQSGVVTKGQPLFEIAPATKPKTTKTANKNTGERG